MPAAGVRGLERCLRVTVADRATMELVAGELAEVADGVYTRGGAGARV